MTEHAPVDGEQAVADLVPVRHALRERRPHAGLSDLFKRRDARPRGQEVHRHIAAATQGRLELLEDEEHLSVMRAGALSGLDVDGPDLPVVLAALEIGTAAQMGVIEAEACGARRERDAARPPRRDERRPLLRSPVDIHGYGLPMPMQLLWRVRLVVNVHDNSLAFCEAQQWTGKLAVIRGGGDDVVWREL